MSAAERRVAEYLVDAGARAAPMSAREIAAAVGTSDATVVRTVKSLGYSSLRDLRRALAHDSDEPDLATRFHATVGGSRSAHDLMSAVVERHLEALDTLLRRVPAADFDHAVDVLTQAEHVWWSGTGPSAHLAGYAAFLCRRLGARAGALTHAGTDHADELLSVGAKHAVVVLAYGRVHPYVQVLLQHARNVGADVVLITDTITRRMTAPVTVRLGAGRGAAGLFATHAPTIVLIEALVLAMGAAEPGRADASLATLNGLRRSLAGEPLDVDPD